MAALAYGLEYYSAVINYPYNSGGRPLDAWPAFMLVPFAVGILAAAIAGFIAFLWRAGCRGCIIPLFAVDGFERASQDRFFLAVERREPTIKFGAAIDFLRDAGATTIRELEPRAGHDARSLLSLPLAVACLALGACDLSMTRAAKAQHLCADVDMARRHLGAAAAGWRRRARRPRTRSSGEAPAAAIDAALLARGRERFGIYCAPCHGLAGDGDGIIVAHGFPRAALLSHRPACRGAGAAFL